MEEREAQFTNIGRDHPDITASIEARTDAIDADFRSEDPRARHRHDKNNKKANGKVGQEEDRDGTL